MGHESCRPSLNEEAWESRLAARLKGLRICVQTKAEVELHYKDYKPSGLPADMVLGEKVGPLQYASCYCFQVS